MRKATNSGADVLVFDLEDAVGPNDREDARRELASVLSDQEFSPEAEVCVRINQPGVAADADLESLPPDVTLDAVMVPKASNAAEIETTARLMAEHGHDYPIFALIETASGVLSAQEIATAEPTTALVFGAEDLAADIGAARSTAGDEVLYAQQRVIIAAAAASIDAIDTVYTDIDDLAGLREAAGRAADLGFDGKLAIHPKQIEAIHDGIRPDDTRVDWARRVVQAAQDTDGVFKLDGEMIDAPLVKRAHRLLERAGEPAE